MSVVALSKNLVLKNFLARKSGLDLVSLEKSLKDVTIDEYDGIASLKLKGLSLDEKSDLLIKLNNAINLTGLTVRPYQYVALLMSALHLYWLKSIDQDAYLAEMNDYSQANYATENFEFTYQDLAYMAFWMATAAGKTMIMHAVMGLLAEFYYEFDGVILLSPSSALSAQHAKALEPIKKALGKNLILYTGDNPGSRINQWHKHDLLITEYSKIVDNRTHGKDTKTLLVREFSGRFLVIVDEGHKGTKSESKDEGVWKSIQQQLAGLKAMDDGKGRTNPLGMIIELSATLGQVAKGDYLAQYAKTVVYDYAYNKFNRDGYGKSPVIRNRAKTEFESSLLLSMLSYWWQLKLYQQRERNKDIPSLVIEKPLWVLLGLTTAGVSKKKQDKEKQDTNSDVQRVILFIQKSLDVQWLTQTISQYLSTVDNELTQNLPRDACDYLLKQKSSINTVMTDVLESVYGFQNQQLVIRQIKFSNGSSELGIGLFDGNKTRYFGVINIGDISGYADFAKKEKIDYSHDLTTGSLFDGISHNNSTINLLIGSRRFAEGWDNYRASTLTSLGLGVSEGTLIIQMFGRMVRLRGVNGTGKRLSKQEIRGHEPLQTAYIFGAGSDYLEDFLISSLSDNGVDLGTEETQVVPVKVNEPLSRFPIPKLAIKPQHEFIVDLRDDWWKGLARPKKSFVSTITKIEEADNDSEQKNRFDTAQYKLEGNDLTKSFYQVATQYFDMNQLYQRLCNERHKAKLWNLHITHESIKGFFDGKHYEVRGFDYHLNIKSIKDIKRLEDVGYALLKSAMISFYRRNERLQSKYAIEPMTSDMIPLLETKKQDAAA
jgi:hypothetical protein